MTFLGLRGTVMLIGAPIMVGVALVVAMKGLGMRITARNVVKMGGWIIAELIEQING